MSPIIDLKNITKYFELDANSFSALKGISFSVNQGELLGIVGRSGSGKTTLMNLMGCLDKPTAGEILIDNKKTHEMNDNELSELRRTSFGFIFQTFNLLPVLSALENVEYPLMLLGLNKTERRNQAEQALKRVGLEPYMAHRPAQLSGGQRQRVAIARAVVKKPKIVFADEPTANLDSKTSSEIFDLLTQLQKEDNSTVIYCSHDPEMIKRASRVIHISDGLLQSGAL